MLLASIQLCFIIHKLWHVVNVEASYKAVWELGKNFKPLPNSLFAPMFRSIRIILFRCWCSYQLDALEKALKGNTIVYLETGSGKTLIAIMLLRSYAHLLRKPSPFIAVFLVPTVVLVTQVCDYVSLLHRCCALVLCGLFDTLFLIVPWVCCMMHHLPCSCLV